METVKPATAEQIQAIKDRLAELDEEQLDTFAKFLDVFIKARMTGATTEEASTLARRAAGIE